MGSLHCLQKYEIIVAAGSHKHLSTEISQGYLCKQKKNASKLFFGIGTILLLTGKVKMLATNNPAVYPNDPTLSKPAAAMVIGGGIGGMRAALDLADAGLKVYLVEQTPCLGGRVAQLGFMFPQHDCVLCRGTPDHGFGYPWTGS